MMNSSPSFLRVGLALLLVLLTVGCAGTRPRGDAVGMVEGVECSGFYRTLNQVIAVAGTGDAGAAPLSGYPFLRVDRFLASFPGRIGGDDRYALWVHALAGLDRQARRVELANLPASGREQLQEKGYSDPEGWLERCSESQTEALLRDPRQRQQVMDAARVPDQYRTWQRVVGVYPVARLFAVPALAALHERQRQPFFMPPAALPTEGRLQRYRPGMGLTSVGPMPIDRRLLGTAWRAPERLRLLFGRFAPLIEVDTLNDGDRIGKPVWREGGELVVDTARPTLYHFISYARFQGAVLLQLNYLFWFPTRETGDIYSGRFDGLIWRVTLRTDDRPLAYDSIHPCGCYYQLFPGPGYQARPIPSGEEQVLVPRVAPELKQAERLVLRLGAGTHYLQGVYPESDDLPDVTANHYYLADYRDLLSMPLPSGGRRSLYAPDGLVPGSERPERFLLWPFGVPSPGAMRQPGTHAIAFVGRRHFDDPWLLESLLSSRF